MNPPTTQDTWTVTTWGDVRSFSTIEAALDEVKEALELGSEYVSIRLVRAPEEKRGVLVATVVSCANHACPYNSVHGVCRAERGECFEYVKPVKA